MHSKKFRVRPGEKVKLREWPTAGKPLCKSKKRLIAEYALRNTRTPIGVSEYLLTRTVPSKLKSSLPTVQALEKELGFR